PPRWRRPAGGVGGAAAPLHSTRPPVDPRGWLRPGRAPTVLRDAGAQVPAAGSPESRTGRRSGRYAPHVAGRPTSFRSWPSRLALSAGIVVINLFGAALVYCLAVWVVPIPPIEKVDELRWINLVLAASYGVLAVVL